MRSVPTTIVLFSVHRDTGLRVDLCTMSTPTYSLSKPACIDCAGDLPERGSSRTIFWRGKKVQNKNFDDHTEPLTTSLTRVLTQGQKDNVLPYVRPEFFNTIMGIRTVLKCPNKVHQRVQRELAVILTCWVVVSQPSLACQNRAKKMCERMSLSYTIHRSTFVFCLYLR